MAKTFDFSVIFSVIEKVTSPLRKAGRAFQKLGEEVKAVGRRMSSMGKSLTMKLTLPLGIFAGVAIKTAADIETMQVAFESLLGSGEEAGKMVKDLIDFTAKTPFQLEGVGKAAKQLLSFGVKADEMQDTLKFLGDIAAGANVPLSDMAAIFGKSKAKGKAMTEELLQLSDRGVPIIDVLAKGFGVAKDKIFDMASKGKISFAAIEKAMRSMSGKGGLFEDQMKKQSATIAGIFSTLKDNVVLAMAEVGKVLVDVFDLKNNMSKLISVIQKGVKIFSEFAKEHPGLIKIAAALLAIAAVAGPLLIVVGSIISMVGGIVALVAAGGGLAAITAALIPILAVVGAITAAFVGVGLAIYQVIKHWDNLKMDFLLGWEWIKEKVFDPILKGVELISAAASTVKGVFVGDQPKGGYSGEEQFFGKGGLAGFEKQQTEIKIKIASDKDSIATVEEVKNITGSPNVNIATEAYVGAH